MDTAEGTEAPKPATGPQVSGGSNRDVTSSLLESMLIGDITCSTAIIKSEPLSASVSSSGQSFVSELRRPPWSLTDAPPVRPAASDLILNSTYVPTKSNLAIAALNYQPAGSGSASGSAASAAKRLPVGRPKKEEVTLVGGKVVGLPRKNPNVKLKRLNNQNLFKGLEAANRTLIKREETGASCATPGPSQPCDFTPGAPASQDICGAEMLDVKSEKLLNDEPEFEEVWPGKVCAFCNLGERSQLGCGEMLRLEVSSDFETMRQSYQPPSLVDQTNKPSPSMELQANGIGLDRSGLLDKSNKGAPQIKKPRLSFKGRRSSSFDTINTCSELQEELNMVGYSEEPDLLSVIEPCGYLYAHQSCAAWSKGVVTSSGTMTGVDAAVLRAISQRCHMCGSYGASLPCSMAGCSKVYHFPCAVTCGAFLNAKAYTTYCTDHVHQGSIQAGAEAQCHTCRSPGNVTNQLFCVTCGRHYHGTCVGLAAAAPGVRTAWQCSDCKLCVTCRTPNGSEAEGHAANNVNQTSGKMLVCDACDKSYHPFCLRPLLSNIPKMGWKCKNCRVCGDCGSRTPGSGPSSRWHACFTVCDSCYQQRNKGVACPICGKAYRHSQREMSQCLRCRKYVHATCDPEADRSLVQRKKELNSDYEYMCPTCKPLGPPPPTGWAEGTCQLVDSEASTPAALRASQESLASGNDMDCSSVDGGEGSNPFSDVDVLASRNRGKPLHQSTSAGKIAKKRITGAVGRPKGSGKTQVGGGAGGSSAVVGGAYNRKPKVAEFGRKRGPKPKMRGVFGAPGLGLQRPQGDAGSGSGSGSGGGTSEGEPCLENRLVLCSAQDEFVLSQDVCVMCGSFGLDQEGRLMACAQCGQCYHPYCANVKVNKQSHFYFYLQRSL